MPLLREPTGELDENGRPRFHVEIVDKDGIRISDPSLTPEQRADQSRFGVAVQTLHATGDVVLSDGTSYNVDPNVIEAASTAHAHEISHHIGLAHEQFGHPTHLPRNDENFHPHRDEFIHVCKADECGPGARSADEIVAALNDRISEAGHGHLIGTSERPLDDVWGPILSHTEVEQRIRDVHAELNSTPTESAAPSTEANV